MVERVTRYREKEPLLERYGVDAEIRSTLSRRVDLPSGGYLVFDYAEAFTVIDVNTGRFVGSRSRTSSSRLEDTITKNNLEAVKEVVRQLRLRDIGGIIVIDFIDMANPKNRQAVEDALRNELERDRTKTYVVEISPLGLVEMTRQNVTEGPREILTRKCPTCGGDGVIVSEQSAAIELERRLRALARGSRVQAFRIEVNAKVAALLVGPGASRLQEIEAAARRRFFLEPAEDVHVDHFAVVAQGKLETVAPQAPFAEGATVVVQPVEVGLYDPLAGVGKLDGYDVVVADAAKLVGKKVKVQVARVLPGVAYATRVGTAGDGTAPITAEGEAEKPTRTRARKDAADADALPTLEDDAADDAIDADDEGGETPKKKTRRGSRGGRRRKKPTIHVPAEDLGADAVDGGGADGANRANGAAPAPDVVAAPSAAAAEPAAEPPPPVEAPPAPSADGEPSRDAEPAAPDAEAEAAAAAAGTAGADAESGLDATADAESAQPKKKTRRGSRGGRNRRKKATATAGAEGSESS
jgi:ribonuclease G